MAKTTSAPKMTAAQFRKLWNGGKSQKKRRMHKRRLSLLTVLGFLPAGYNAYNIIRQPWDWNVKAMRLSQYIVNMVTMYDPVEKRFRWDEFAKYSLPVIGGILAHKYLGKYVNRFIPRSIPVEL